MKSLNTSCIETNHSKHHKTGMNNNSLEVRATRHNSGVQPGGKGTVRIFVTNMKEPVYTVSVAAKMLSVNKRWLLVWMKKHGLGVQPGGRHSAWILTRTELLLIYDRKYKRETTRKREDLSSIDLNFIYEGTVLEGIPVYFHKRS